MCLQQGKQECGRFAYRINLNSKYFVYQKFENKQGSLVRQVKLNDSILMPQQTIQTVSCVVLITETKKKAPHRSEKGKLKKIYTADAVSLLFDMHHFEAVWFQCYLSLIFVFILKFIPCLSANKTGSYQFLLQKRGYIQGTSYVVMYKYLHLFKYSHLEQILNSGLNFLQLYFPLIHCPL